MANEVEDELLRLGVSKVYILGATGVISDQVIADINAAIPGYVVDRLFGNNRFQAAIKIAEEYLEVLGLDQFNNLVIASGMNFPDALVAVLMPLQTRHRYYW